MDVLRALEETSWNIKPEEIEEVRRTENWKFSRNGRPEAFADNRHNDDDAYFRLAGNAHRINLIVKTLRTLLDAALDIQQQLETSLRRHPKPIIVRQGITALPDELLGQIFTYSIALDGHNSAILISHVCRHFRRVAIEKSDLWTTIHSKAHSGELDMFLSRSGHDTGLHIVIDMSADDEIADFMEKCRPVAHRWKSLSILEPVNRPSIFRTLSIVGVLRLIDGDAQQNFDKLETLHLSDKNSNYLMRYFTNNIASEDNFTLLWASPRLRHLRFVGYVPSPAPAFASVTSLTFLACVRPHNFETETSNLLSFLAATPSITDLALEIQDFFVVRDPGMGSYRFPRAHCPSVTSLSLRFVDFAPTPGGRENHLVSALTSTLFIPRLETLSLSVEFRYMEIRSPNLNGELGVELFRNLSQALLSSTYTGSHLTSLTYEFTLDARRPNITLDSDIIIPPRTFTMPLDRVPTLTSLKLKTFIDISFSRDRSFDPCHLRELHLRDCDEMNDGSLRQMTESLKAAGVWDGIGNIIVKNCKALRFETALNAIGREKLQFLEL